MQNTRRCYQGGKPSLVPSMCLCSELLAVESINITIQETFRNSQTIKISLLSFFFILIYSTIVDLHCCIIDFCTTSYLGSVELLFDIQCKIWAFKPNHLRTTELNNVREREMVEIYNQYNFTHACLNTILTLWIWSWCIVKRKEKKIDNDSTSWIYCTAERISNSKKTCILQKYI